MMPDPEDPAPETGASRSGLDDVIARVRSRPAIAHADLRALDAFVMFETPGHLLRRCWQRSQEIFVEEVGDGGPTSPQFAVMLAIHQQPGISQTALVSLTGIDRSTMANMIARLAKQDIVRRQRTDRDQRLYALNLTDKGLAMVAAAAAGVARAQDRILEPIPSEVRRQFLWLLALIADLPGPGPDGGEQDSG